uniref:SANT domain-containing protein n=1 Tax=Ditylenchus dipsaci TaxID=166011 RepID=A0A915CP62_9BILA
MTAEAQLYSLAMQHQMSSLLAILQQQQQQQQQQATNVPLMQQQLRFPVMSQQQQPAANFPTPSPSSKPVCGGTTVTRRAVSTAPVLDVQFRCGITKYFRLNDIPATAADTSRSILNFHSQLSQQQATPSQPEAIDVEDEAAKRALSERMEKIDRERIQTNNTLKTAVKKMELCQKIILSNKEPDEDSEADEGDINELKDSSTNEIDSLVDKIYADNKKKAQASNTMFAPFNSNVVECVKLNETYEKGLKLLPSLINAMRIQRNKQKDSLDKQQVEYSEQLAVWEKKVAKSEKILRKLLETNKERKKKEITDWIEWKDLDALSLLEGLRLRPISRIMNMRLLMPKCVQNGLVENALTDARNRLESFLNVWSEEEKEIFSKKIAVYGKNFAAISAFLQSKSVKDCVLMYYMSKKRKQYKLKFAKRRKKIGRQYRPPTMPAAHELDTCNNQFQGGARSSSFVECLLCEARINVFPSSRDTIITAPFYDPYGFDLADECVGGSNLSICAKCTNVANKNKAANRCPLGTCMCGKRKMKPVRTVPEKFHSLSAENKRFIVNRLKLPPAATKCCTPCNKKITKEVENLLEGQLKEEMDVFNQKLADVGKIKNEVLQTISDDEDAAPNSSIMPSNWSNVEEQVDKNSLLLKRVIDSKDVLMNVDQGDGRSSYGNQPVSEAPPYKEIKLEIPEPAVLPVADNRFIKVKKEEVGDAMMATKENLPTISNISSPRGQSSAHNFGSITQGTPLVRPASIKGMDIPMEQLISQQNAALIAAASSARSQLTAAAKANELRNSPASTLQQHHQRQQQQQQSALKGLPEELNNFESFASTLLEHFESRNQGYPSATQATTTKSLSNGKCLPGTSSLPDFGPSLSHMNQFNPTQLMDPNLGAALLNANVMAAAVAVANPTPAAPTPLPTSSMLSTASLLDDSVQKRAIPAETAKPKTVKQYLQQQQQQQQQASSSKRIDLSNTARSSPNQLAKEAAAASVMKQHQQQQAGSSVDIADLMKRKSGIATAMLPTLHVLQSQISLRHPPLLLLNAFQYKSR